MPLYEGIGLINEKPAVVIDIGEAYTKVGFAGEVGPHAIVPSTIVCRKTRKQLPLYSFMESEAGLHDAVIEFFQNVYEKLLLVNAKERAVVLVEDVCGSSLLRSVIARVLFTYFDVPSIAAVPGHVLALFPLGDYTACVVDLGFKETTVLPVCEGIPLMKAWISCSLASTSVNARLKEELLAHGKLILPGGEEVALTEAPFQLDDKTIEDIKVRACFVTPMNRAEARKEGKALEECSDLIYPYSRDSLTHTIRVPGRVRETAADVLFEPNEDLVTIQMCIVDSILKCPLDLRAKMVENLVVCGGVAAMRGLRKRLMQELHKEVKNRPPYKEKLCVSNFQLYDSPTPTNCLFWFGGSVLGSTPQLPIQAVTREAYVSAGTLTDWCDMRYESSPDTPKLVKA